jgi:hypothetical protein
MLQEVAWVLKEKALRVYKRMLCGVARECCKRLCIVARLFCQRLHANAAKLKWFQNRHPKKPWAKGEKM